MCRVSGVTNQKTAYKLAGYYTESDWIIPGVRIVLTLKEATFLCFLFVPVLINRGQVQYITCYTRRQCPIRPNNLIIIILIIMNIFYKCCVIYLITGNYISEKFEMKPIKFSTVTVNC